eukprot:Em1363g1a
MDLTIVGNKSTDTPGHTHWKEHTCLGEVAVTTPPTPVPLRTTTTYWNKITGPLGTGHFSFVSRGVWKDAQGVAREVAIKSLACTDPMSKVKFLQEAVIMGQFKHPSVVQLCGSMMEGDT